MRTSIRLAGAFALLLAGACTHSDSTALEAAPQTTDHAIVVAELFTSEGCSSCPPADEVLRRLIQRQLVPGVQVVALGEHLDYWDRLGWRNSSVSAATSMGSKGQSARPCGLRKPSSMSS